MTYFNGGDGGYYWLGQYVPLTTTTRIYCDVCADAAIPLPPHGPNGDSIGRHWETGFKWAPYYGGNAICTRCGKPC
jgi:hypothetical protein